MEKGRLNCVKFFNVTVIFRVEAYGYSTVHTEDVLYYNKGISAFLNNRLLSNGSTITL